MSSKRSFTSRASRPSYPSIQEEPDLIGFASVSMNVPNDPKSASLPNNSSGSSASISAIKTTLVPNSLAADLGLLFTSSDAANQFIPLEHFDPLADTSNTAIVTATPSESALSNTSLHVVVESEGENFQQTMFPSLSGTFIAPETHVKAPLLEPDTRPLFSLGNTLDFFVQHYIDFAFRFSRVCIQHSKCRCRSLATCL